MPGSEAYAGELPRDVSYSVVGGPIHTVAPSLYRWEGIQACNPGTDRTQHAGSKKLSAHKLEHRFWYFNINTNTPHLSVVMRLLDSIARVICLILKS